MQVGVYQESGQLSLLFVISLDVITKYAKKGLLNEISLADDLFPIILKVKRI